MSTAASRRRSMEARDLTALARQRAGGSQPGSRGTSRAGSLEEPLFAPGAREAEEGGLQARKTASAGLKAAINQHQLLCVSGSR